MWQEPLIVLNTTKRSIDDPSISPDESIPTRPHPSVFSRPHPPHPSQRYPVPNELPLQVSQESPAVVPRAVALVAAMTTARDDDRRLLAIVTVGGLHAIRRGVHDRCRRVRHRWEHRRRLIVSLGTSWHGCGHGHDLDGRGNMVGVGHRLGHRVSLSRHHLHLGCHRYTVR
jgi:hypothetical protein